MVKLNEIYNPMLLWCQDSRKIILTVELSDVENVDLKTEVDSIHFQATGHGANNLADYGFDMNLYESVCSEKTQYKITDSSVIIVILKHKSGIWPRLVRSTDRLAWLKTDFNRISNEMLNELAGESSNDENGTESVTVDLIRPSAEEQKRHLTEIAVKQVKEDFNELVYMLKNPLIIYLTMYNIFQWAGYSYVFGSLITNWWSMGNDVKPRAFHLVADRLLIVQIASFLEIAHALLGWVKGGINQTIIQVCHRNLIFFLIIIPHNEVQAHTAVFNLFSAWSLIEIVRYPYYLLRLFSEQIDLVTYLRYTFWIPLYPIGFINEGKLIIYALPLLEKSHRFCLRMPNLLNFSFEFSTFLHVYVILMLPAFFYLMQYMYQQRKKILMPEFRMRGNRVPIANKH